MSEKLKPCPCCNGKAELSQIGSKKLKIKCTSCLIKLEQKTLRFSLEWLEEKMIETWNTRTAPQNEKEKRHE